MKQQLFHAGRGFFYAHALHAGPSKGGHDRDITFLFSLRVVIRAPVARVRGPGGAVACFPAAGLPARAGSAGGGSGFSRPGGVAGRALSGLLAAMHISLPGPAALVAPAALAGALLALAGALWLGRGDGGFRRESVILAGIAVAAFLGALVALIKALNEESVTSIVFWIMGSFQGRGWDSLPLLLATFVPGLIAVALGWRALDVLTMGDEQAAQLGLNVGRARLWLLAGASCMTAGCVAVAGVIGFVGLVVPHVLRLVLGCGHGPLLAGAFFGGGVLLVWADVLARSVLDGGQELPVGVVTALLGGPFFALLVRRRT